MGVVYRRGSSADSRAVFEVFEAAVLDLGQRIGAEAITGGYSPEDLERLWERRRPLFEHLARTSDQFWVAERAGRPVGYARSIRRGELQELTELFVLPGEQEAGVGRELLLRSFPRGAAGRRAIIATIDVRAQARYLKLGIFPRFPIYYLSRAPAPVEPSAPAPEPVEPSAEQLAALAAIDQALIGHRRDEDHRWLATERQGFLYRRDGRPAGYGYVGDRGSGPLAVLDPADLPALLAHAEALAYARGVKRFGLDVPSVNETAVTYLLGRGYRIDPFLTFFMSDRPFGSFERYIVTTPSFFI